MTLCLCLLQLSEDNRLQSLMRTHTASLAAATAAAASAAATVCCAPVAAVKNVEMSLSEALRMSADRVEQFPLQIPFQESAVKVSTLTNHIHNRDHLSPR